MHRRGWALVVSILLSSIAGSAHPQAEDVEGWVLDRLCFADDYDLAGRKEQKKIDTLEELGEDGRRVLLELSEGPEPIRKCAWKYLTKIGDDRIRAILKSAASSENESSTARVRAVRYLAKLGDESALSYGERFLASNDTEVASGAAVALGAVDDDRARQLLREHLKATLGLTDVRVRTELQRWLVQAIGVQRDASAVSLLITVVDENRGEPRSVADATRANVVSALSRIPSKDAWAALPPLLSEIEGRSLRRQMASNARNELLKVRRMRGEFEALDLAIEKIKEIELASK